MSLYWDPAAEPGTGYHVYRTTSANGVDSSVQVAKSHVLDDLKFSPLPASVPEPGTYALSALGLAALAVHLRRQQRPR